MPCVATLASGAIRGTGTFFLVNTWFEYRSVWAAHPWLLAYAVLVVAVLVLSVIGMFVGGPLAILFIPGLAGAYFHHLLVMKRVP